MKKTYKAYLLLDESKNEARYNEETRESSKSFTASERSIGFSAEKKFFRGKIFVSKEYGKEWSFIKRGARTSFEKVYDYSFDVKEIREPMRARIIQ